MEKQTIVVNLIGAPGAGKSTAMGEIFALLKNRDVDCEMVSEFAKELVRERKSDTFNDPIYIFAKQNHALSRVAGKVDVIITDSPLVISELYCPFYKELNDLVYKEFSKYDNRNFFIERTKKYNPNGRNQTEEESDTLSQQLKSILHARRIPFEIHPSGRETAVRIADKIYDELMKRRKE